MSDSAFPLEDTRLPLPSGGHVIVLNRIISTMRDTPGGALTIQYRSTVAASDRKARFFEAQEVARVHEPFADTRGFLSIRAEVCNSLAAAQMREPAEAGFQFVRDSTGTWVADRAHDYP